MKNLLFLLGITLILLTACSQESEKSRESESIINAYDEQGEFDNSAQAQSKTKTKKNNFKYHSLMSPEFGIPYGRMSIPESWQVSNNTEENLLFEGPDGVKIYNAQFSSFFYSNDPYLNQITQQNGRTVRPPKNIDLVIKEDMIPFMNQQGYQFKGQFRLPELAQFDTRFDSYLFKASPEQRQYQCVVTEWENQQGKPAMVVVRYFTAQYQVGGLDWGYTLNAMEADKSIYNETKQACFNALVNFDINPQWVEMNNQHYAQLAQQSNAGHQQRMGAIKAQGDAILQAGRERSAMSDRSHEKYMNNLRSDNGQSQFIDNIRDETNVTSAYDGNTYKVESGSNYYWMNANGEYVQTDDANWNPNTDPAYNNQNWNQTTIKK